MSTYITEKESTFGGGKSILPAKHKPSIHNTLYTNYCCTLISYKLDTIFDVMMRILDVHTVFIVCKDLVRKRRSLPRVLERTGAGRVDTTADQRPVAVKRLRSSAPGRAFVRPVTRLNTRPAKCNARPRPGPECSCACSTRAPAPTCITRLRPIYCICLYCWAIVNIVLDCCLDKQIIRSNSAFIRYI